MEAKPKKTVILVLADKTNNAGEVEYMYAMAEVLAEKGDGEIDYRVCVIPTPQTVFKTTRNEVFFKNDQLPRNEAQYDRVAVADGNVIEGLVGEVEVIGVGRSTLVTVLDIQQRLKEKNIEPQVSYLTHQPYESDIKAIIENNVRVLSKTDTGTPGNILLEDVPHTNTVAQCAVEWANFAQTENGKIVQKWREDGEIYAAIVLNAGFEVEDADGNRHYQPYTMNEAYEFGYALARYLPIDTPLLLAHGGPRNNRDKYDGDQATTDAFIQGYRSAQALDDTDSRIVVEEFEKGLPYNVTKAILHMSRDPHCNTLLACDGHGLIAGSYLNSYNVRAIKREELLEGEEGRLTAFCPSQVALDEPKQLANMQKCHRNGFDVFVVQGEELFIQPSPRPKALPDATRNPAFQVVKALDLVP